VDGRSLLLLLSSQLEVLAAANILHGELGALFALQLKGDLLGNLRWG